MRAGRCLVAAGLLVMGVALGAGHAYAATAGAHVTNPSQYSNILLGTYPSGGQAVTPGHVYVLGFPVTNEGSAALHPNLCIIWQGADHGWIGQGCGAGDLVLGPGATGQAVATATALAGASYGLVWLSSSTGAAPVTYTVGPGSARDTTANIAWSEGVPWGDAVALGGDSETVTPYSGPVTTTTAPATTVPATTGTTDRAGHAAGWTPWAGVTVAGSPGSTVADPVKVGLASAQSSGTSYLSMGAAVVAGLVVLGLGALLLSRYLRRAARAGAGEGVKT